jgi:hypothetical protein
VGLPGQAHVPEPRQAHGQAVVLRGETGGGQCELFAQIGAHWLWRTSDPFGSAAAGGGGAGGGGGGGGGAGEAAAALFHGEVALQALGGARTRRHASAPRFGRCLRLALDARGGAVSADLQARRDDISPR